MSVLRVLSRSGDDRYTWTRSSATVDTVEADAAVREAERIFAEQRARGATAVRMAPGKPAARIEKFDPEAEEIVMIPRVIGG